MPDLVEDREAVVEEVVEDVVEQVARSPCENRLVAQALVVLDAVEQARDRQQLDVRQRDDVVAAEEDVELGGVQAPDGLVVTGKWRTEKR